MQKRREFYMIDGVGVKRQTAVRRVMEGLGVGYQMAAEKLDQTGYLRVATKRTWGPAAAAGAGVDLVNSESIEVIQLRPKEEWAK